MKRNLGLLAVAAIALVGCQAPTAASAPTSIQTTTSALTIPDVAGKNLADASFTLSEAGLYNYSSQLSGGTETLSVGTDDFTRYIVESVRPGTGSRVAKGDPVRLTVKPNPGDPPRPSSPPVKSTTQSAPVTKAAPKPTGEAAIIVTRFPGYPLLVRGSALDYRVASWFEGKLVNDQVVALAPGLYTPYNPNVEDLLSYYEGAGVYGDSIIKRTYLPTAGGAYWSGVLPGPDEPK